MAEPLPPLPPALPGAPGAPGGTLGPGSSAADSGLPLCDSQALEEAGTAHVWDVLEYGRPARAFVLRFEGELRGYMNRCLHVPTEMDWQPGEFMDSDRRWILCSLHGATYDPRDGRCIGGPCGRGKLRPVAVSEAGGQVRWYPSADIQPRPAPSQGAGPAATAAGAAPAPGPVPGAPGAPASVSTPNPGPAPAPDAGPLP